MADPRPLTREELARFLPDQRSIRAFEKLFSLIPDDLVTLEFLAKLKALSPEESLQNVISTDYIDFNRNPKVAARDGRGWWNPDEGTLNLGMVNGVVQQVGFEQFIRAENDTGSQIDNGEIVGFAGVNGELKISKYIADGTVPDLYFVGVATSDMADGDVAPITTFGKVRDFDTTGTPVGETWLKGDILYASPTTAGKLTKVRPTAPNAVIVVAAVLKVDATAGEILVRPTVPLGLDYASFSDTTDQTIAAINTAYPIQLNTTDISHGVTVENDGSGNPTEITVSQAGLYAVTVSNQYTSSSSSQKDIQTWLRQNGVDIANSNSYVTIDLNGGTVIFATSYLVSMEANDYLQIMWAADSTAVSINNIPATAYSPAAPSTIVTINQTQL